jgi:hypothetical protein
MLAREGCEVNAEGRRKPQITQMAGVGQVADPSASSGPACPTQVVLGVGGREGW